ncbi:MAG TPA: SpoIID/LytB domain-containing protein, partial [Acidimicrobiales bacterium]|nr:SpoIID/LytB domain-containing protein [Acidimicrobiales bacterium]
LLLAAGFAGTVATAPPAAAYPNPQVELIGHGFGHGRGMGQFGSLGYAIDHGWAYKQILGHYYGGTTEGNIGNPSIPVRLSRMDGKATLVQQERGQMRIAGEGTTYSALQVAPLGNNQWQVSSGPSCAGPWTPVGGARLNSVTIEPTVGSNDYRDMLQVCEGGANRWYRGVIESHYNGATAETINRLDMESYLRGVVPRESPASWADLGGGAGIHALRAQSVAARSYAQAEDRPGVSETCDTISCQVYLGVAEQVGSSPFKLLEDARTDRAIADTAGEVRMLDGAVARTEFSSSTGGITAGGVFPVVTDDGDDTASNPNHNWTAKIGVDVIEAKYGRGTLEDIKVLERNGLGAEGGRVKRLLLVFSGDDLELTGDDFRRAFSLKSDWFTPVNVASFPYHVLTRDGGVFSFGGAEFHGSLPGIGVRTPARDITEGPGGGYWILGEDGGVFSFDVPFYGSMGGQRLNRPVVGMEATASRQGYWLVAGDGGIFSFGDAPFHGSTGNLRLNQPVVAMAPTRSGAGYWMVATDGGIFTFGDAPFHGSTGDIRLNQPVFAMAPTPSGNGYWLVARDGGIFTFGDATFQGSLPGKGVLETAVELLPSPSGFGYLIVTAQGRVHAFGDASSGGGPADVGAGPSPAVGAGRVR